VWGRIAAAQGGSQDRFPASRQERQPHPACILLSVRTESNESMSLVNAVCAEISVFQGIGEKTGVTVERRAVRGKPGLCKSMRELAIKSRVLGDGYYYLPIELWPSATEPVVIHKSDWTVIGSIPRTKRTTRKRRPAEQL
jgi:hypothetical protein